MSAEAWNDVVVGVGSVAGSRGAMRYAVAEAGRRGAAVRVVHVIPQVPLVLPERAGPLSPEELAARGRRVLAEAQAAVQAVDPGQAVTTVLSQGSRAAELVRAGGCAALMVIGQEGRATIPWLSQLNPVSAVVSTCAAPVVVVPPEWAGDEAGRVLLAVRSSADLEKALGAAFEVVVGRAARLVVLQTNPERGTRPGSRAARAESRRDLALLDDLEAVVAPWRRRHPDVAVECAAVHGGRAEVLLAQSRQVDEVLLAGDATPDLAAHLGAATRALLCRAGCPVRLLR